MPHKNGNSIMQIKLNVFKNEIMPAAKNHLGE